MSRSVPLPVPDGPAPRGTPQVYAFVDLTYAELHAIARGMLRSQASGITLQATVLLHDAFVRMAARAEGWNDRQHFVRSIACAMRSVLVDYIRKRNRREPTQSARELDVLVEGLEIVTGDLLKLNEALEALGQFDPNAVRLIELHYFTALSVEECADIVGLSKRQTERELQIARGWLRQRMS
jgi:RNA polymerase sigma factor (TIGR02999 family)